jgi:hypothetical protein
MKTRGTKLFRLAVALFFLIAGAGGRTAEPNPLEGVKNLHATDFTSEQFFEAPNEQKVKLRLSGAAAEPLPGGLLNVQQLKIETFDTNGLTQAVVQAPQCTYAPLDGWASSPGWVKIRSGDGQSYLEGEGFLLRQTNELITISISNHVHTVIEITGDNPGLFL